MVFFFASKRRSSTPEIVSEINGNVVECKQNLAEAELASGLHIHRWVTVGWLFVRASRKFMFLGKAHEILSVFCFSLRTSD